MPLENDIRSSDTAYYRPLQIGAVPSGGGCHDLSNASRHFAPVVSSLLIPFPLQTARPRATHSESHLDPILNHLCFTLRLRNGFRLRRPWLRKKGMYRHGLRWAEVHWDGLR